MNVKIIVSSILLGISNLYGMSKLDEKSQLLSNKSYFLMYLTMQSSSVHGTFSRLKDDSQKIIVSDDGFSESLGQSTIRALSDVMSNPMVDNKVKNVAEHYIKILEDEAQRHAAFLQSKLVRG